MIFPFHNPHAFLGVHFSRAEEEGILRIWAPSQTRVEILSQGELHLLSQSEVEGLFCLKLASPLEWKDYTIKRADGSWNFDPYAFLPSIGDLDQHLFHKGVHYQVYDMMGARMWEQQGCQGVRFVLWAPNAKEVYLVGDFNQWNPDFNPMRSMGYSGLWELFIPGLREGMHYKFVIHTKAGERLLKTDPYAFYAETYGQHSSRIFDINTYVWKDQEWMQKRAVGEHLPSLIYELHLGSWKKGKNYQELAREVVDYCLYMGFGYVELLPIMEHPLDESWGYQVTGFYAPTARFGSPRDFQEFVDYLHQKGIGVIIDWVPAHFPFDDFSLARFDGSCLYEHEDPRKGWHPHWKTAIFNYSRPEVSNFLLGSALFWCDKMHVDGIRVDAVASMLYLDYGREQGAWEANCFGGKENLEAIEFLKHFNAIVHERCPGVTTFAEESTAFPGVTHSVSWGGLGFDRKWNMGWMHDTLNYFKKDPLYRKYHHEEILRPLSYAGQEKFILVLSHDEVVHGKGSLYHKMPGDHEQKMANLRLLYSFFFCQPGKKLLFMGAEIGEQAEWNIARALEWEGLRDPLRKGLQFMIKDLAHLYSKMPIFYKPMQEADTIGWIFREEVNHSLVAYERFFEKERILCVHNFTPLFWPEYILSPPYHIQKIESFWNSDRVQFGGYGKIKEQVIERKKEGFSLSIPPLATVIYKIYVL